MNQEITCSIIKPNAIKKNKIGEIISDFEKKGLTVVAAKLVRLTKTQCEEFYKEHFDKPFFSELVSFMSSGPVLLIALSGENAVMKNREIMGATDPAEASPESLRARFGDSVGENAVHGSDSLESAQRELSFFFKTQEYVN